MAERAQRMGHIMRPLRRGGAEYTAVGSGQQLQAMELGVFETQWRTEKPYSKVLLRSAENRGRVINMGQRLGVVAQNGREI